MTKQRAVVTLREADPVDLERVQHRRRQLFVLLILVFVLFTAVLVLLSYASEVFLGWEFPLDLDVLRVSLALLAIALCVYVWDKERRLGHTEHALIEERVLSAALENRVRELNAILRAGRAVASTLSLDDVLDLILHSAKELLGATEGSVMLFDEDKEVLRVAAAVGLSEDVKKSEIPVGEGVAGWVAEFREGVVLSGDVIDPRFRHFIPKGRDVRSAMSAPLYARADPVGVLNVSVSSGDREYTEHDLRALTVFAEHAAIAINNARVFKSEREAASKLVELDERRREFLALVTHDLKAPLTSVLGYVRLLTELGESATPDQSRQFLEIIDRQGRRMFDMIEQLVMATSLEDGAPILNREPLDLRALLRDQMSMFEGPLDGRVLDLEVPADMPTVYGDRAAIEHIVGNLLDNAAKYSPDGTPIEVRVIPEDEEVRISVADRGPGIAPELLPRVFERYRRAQGHGSEGSVGLGLFIVRTLAQGHGGRVWAENRDDGGTELTFTLPLRRARMPAAQG